MEQKNFCECRYWARTNGFISHHHPNCIHYNPEKDMRELLESLIDGIDCWAADEDGVHPELCEAYDRAAVAIGRPLLKKEK